MFWPVIQLLLIGTRIFRRFCDRIFATLCLRNWLLDILVTARCGICRLGHVVSSPYVNPMTRGYIFCGVMRSLAVFGMEKKEKKKENKRDGKKKRRERGKERKRGRG